MCCRTDPKKTYYTGAICGLGWDPESGGSALPDHDMEVTFDTTIDQEDLETVSNFRSVSQTSRFTSRLHQSLAMPVKSQNEIMKVAHANTSLDAWNSRIVEYFWDNNKYELRTI